MVEYYISIIDSNIWQQFLYKMANNGQNTPQQNPINSNVQQQSTINKLGKPTPEQIKNIFSRNVIKNPLRGPQTGSDEQRAMQSSKPPPPIQGQLEQGEITQPVNSQLSYSRPVTPPQMPNFNQTIPLTNSPFKSNSSNPSTFGSTNIAPNIAIQQTPKNDFKLTVGESNKPITTPIQTSNIFANSKTANPNPTNILSSQPNNLGNRLNTSASPGIINPSLSQTSQIAGKNALASLSKIQQHRQVIVPVNNNQALNIPTGEPAITTLQTLFKHAKFDESQLSLQLNPCNIKNTKLLLLNQVNKMMSATTIDLNKLKLSNMPLIETIDNDQIYYMLYQYSQCKQQLARIQKLTKTYEQNAHKSIKELNKKIQTLKDSSSNVFYSECYITKIGERYNRIEKQINSLLIPLIESRKRGYAKYFCQDPNGFDLCVANQIKDSLGNLGNGIKEVSTKLNIILRNIEQIDEKNGKYASQIIIKLEESFKVIKNDLELLSKTQQNPTSPKKSPKKCQQLLEKAANFLIEIDQTLIKISTKQI